jgi:hypothetical protein
MARAWKFTSPPPRLRRWIPFVSHSEGGTAPLVVTRRSPFYHVLSLAIPVSNGRSGAVKTTVPYADLRVLVALSWHPEVPNGSRQVLEYWFRDGATRDTTATGDTLVLSQPWPIGDSANIEIQPRADAALLADGLDNAIDEYQLMFQVRNGPSGRALRFSIPTISNAEGSIAGQMDPAVARAHAVGDVAGVRAIWGLEVGATAPTLAGTHWDSVSGAGRRLALYVAIQAGRLS